MCLLKKIIVLSLSCLILPAIWADEAVDKALVDIIYESIEDKKVVVLNTNWAISNELKNKAKEYNADITFLDIQIMNGQYDDLLFENFQQLERLDNPELYLTALVDPTGFITHYIDIYDTKCIALLEQPHSLYVGEYIPSVQGVAFQPIKKAEFTKKSLNESLMLFNEFVKKYEEATVSINEEDIKNDKISNINKNFRFIISSSANILAWNATLIEEYEIAEKLYACSIKYSFNTSSILSRASLNKEGKLKSIKKDAIEENLITMTSMFEDKVFLEKGFILYFNGFVYGAKHYLEANWDWVIFGIPKNSPEFPSALQKISESNKSDFEKGSVPNSKQFNKQLVDTLKKYNLPKKLSDFTANNYFTLYSIIRNRNDEYSRLGRQYIISKIENRNDVSEKLKLRFVIENGILHHETLITKSATEYYLENYEYNRQVAIAALLCYSRLMTLNSQKVIINKIIENEGEKAPKWALIINKAMEEILSNPNAVEFKNHCYDAVMSYNGSDPLIIGYLYNLYSFSTLITGGIKDPKKEKIDLTKGKILIDKKYFEADMVYYAAGSYFLQQNNPELAIYIIKDAYSKNRYSQIYLNDLIVALTECGDYEVGRDALKDHDKEIQPLDLNALDTLAVCIVRANPHDAQEALATLERAQQIAIDENLDYIPPELYLHFAEIYNVLDNKDEAKKYLNKFLDTKLERELLNNDKKVLENLKNVLK